MMLGIPLAIGVFAASKSASAWQMVALIAFALVLCWLWLSRFRLEFDDNSIGYSSLFTGYRTIPRGQIVEANFAGETSPFESPFTFVLRTSTGEELRINAKVFSRQAVQELQSVAPQQV
jgi:hypothetical protein